MYALRIVCLLDADNSKQNTAHERDLYRCVQRFIHFACTAPSLEIATTILHVILIQQLTYKYL